MATKRAVDLESELDVELGEVFVSYAKDSDAVNAATQDADEARRWARKGDNVKRMRLVDAPLEGKYDASPWRRFQDDDGRGFVLRMLRAPDGDIHLGVDWDADAPNADEIQLSDTHHDGLSTFTLRVRSPWIGGGSHPELYAALVEVFRNTVGQQTPRKERPGG
jgi:hypothetical protein